MARLRIFVNYMRFSKQHGSTDVVYPHQLSSLTEYNRDVIITFNDSRISALLADVAARLSITRLNQPKFGPIANLIRFLSRNTLVFPWQLRNVDVAWSHWFFPVMLTRKNIPLLFSSGFASNRFAGVSSDEERRSEVRQLGAWFRRATLISFPAQCFINHFNAIDAGFAAKLVFLPVLLSVSAVESADEIERKFASSEHLRLLFVAKDGRLKGLYELHQALTMLVEQNSFLASKLSLTVVSQTECPSVEGIKIVQHRSLPRSEVLKLMRDSHVFCLPTKRDAYGFVILEAMAAGCAIITDNVEPRTEFLEDGRCGILTDTRVESVAAAIASLIWDWSFAQTLAINAWKRYKSTYDFRVTAFQYIEQLSILAGQQDVSDWNHTFITGQP